MLDRAVWLARPDPEKAANVPAASVVRIKRQGMINQRYHGADVLAEIGQRKGGIRQDPRVVAGYLQGSPREIGALEAIGFPSFAPIVIEQAKTADGSKSKCRPVTRIARDRPFQQTKRLGDSSRRRQEHGIGPQIAIVLGQIVGQAGGGTAARARSAVRAWACFCFRV